MRVKRDEAGEMIPPKQTHMREYFDAYVAVGRTDVSDLLEETLEGINMSLRSYPDLYAHQLTKALLDAGYLREPRTDVPVHLLMWCKTCGQSFVPADEDDTIHLCNDETGEYCGGEGRWAYGRDGVYIVR